MSQTASLAPTLVPEQPSWAPLRHLLATLAYRAAKVLRETPEGFATFQLAPGRRLPVEIVAHLGDLMDWALRMARGELRWVPAGSADWDHEVARLFAGFAALDAQLAAEEPPPEWAERLVQGPLADALTHVGQLALLRGAAGAPVRPESYARAAIAPGRVGTDQLAPRAEFAGDASKPR